MTVQSHWLRHRGVLLGATLLALAIGSSAIAVWAMYRLPPAEHAQGRDLMRWLVTRDLREESEATRRSLVLQLEVFLEESHDHERTAAEMNEQRRHTLEENVGVLLPVWLELGAERHLANEPANRQEFLDKQLSRVEQVGELSQLWRRAARKPTEANPLFGLVETVEQIVADAPEEKKAQLATYVRALKMRWFVTADLTELGTASLAELSRRVEAELREGLVLEEQGAKLDPARSRQLWRNVDLLAEVWFQRQVKRYTQLPSSQRNDHMQELVADISSWPIVKQQLTPAPAKSGFASALSLLTNNPLAHAMAQMSAAERRVENWIRRAPADEQEAMRIFTTDAKRTLRQRHLREMLPSATNS
ncbi:MAG: hypothetical protein MI757_09320 [Pirellulales bacterium]|nr:hypothetical protein [Pirellulales bacterium]